MSTVDNQALVLKWLELWNHHALDQLHTLVSPHYIHHTSAGEHVDFDAFRKGFANILHSYPDMHYTVQHWLAQDDLVAVYLTAQATLHAPFFGIAPHGQHTTFTGIYHCRIQDGKIVKTGTFSTSFPPSFILAPLSNLPRRPALDTSPASC